MEWKKYSLPHVIYDQYKRNTDLNYNRWGGDYYFLAFLSDHEHIHHSVIIASFVLALPFWIFNFGVVLMVNGLNILLLGCILSALDTYSVRKYRIRQKVRKSIDWMLDPEAHKKRRP